MEQEFNLDEYILGVQAKKDLDGRITLKYLAISGGCGPQLTMDESLAQQTIDALQALLVVEEAHGTTK